MNAVQILILDFGSQYTQLIARRLREYGVYTEIVSYFESLDSIRTKNPKGIILSGGPSSIYEDGAYRPDSGIFDLGIPILGICYGMQYIIDFFGGKVIKAKTQEFGKAILEIIDFSLQFDSIKKSDIDVLLSLWESSVLATHHFLNHSEIKAISQDVLSAFEQVEHIIVARYQDNIVGFIGVHDATIEMLFVTPKMFKKGIGKALIKEAYKRVLKDLDEIFVDCNEQNSQGLNFYQKVGFERVGRSAKDPQGRDYPIIHFRITNQKLRSYLGIESYMSLNKYVSNQEKIIIHTKRTYLREFCTSDIDALHSILGDSRVMWAWEHGFSRDESINWLNTQLNRYREFGFGNWAVIDRDSGELIGNVGLNYEDINIYKNGDIVRERIVEISYIIKHSYWHKGYATECAFACREYASRELNIPYIYCLIRDDNYSSIKIARSLGMYIIGENIKIDSNKVDGKYNPRNIELVFKSGDYVCDDIYNNHAADLFKGVKQNSTVWMSHCDRADTIPKDFIELARSNNINYCAIANIDKNIYALQFHPEVVHSECGGRILKNFATNICNASCNWSMSNFIESKITNLRKIVFGEINPDICTESSLESKSQIDSISCSDISKPRCAWITTNNDKDRQIYLDYHDNEWGVPLHDDNKLFEILLLEGFQAGLSWLTILKKRENFREAFNGFDPKLVALFNEDKINLLMENESIIRNRLKIESAINNAQKFIEIQNEFGSFDNFIWSYVDNKPIINDFQFNDEIPTHTALSDKISRDLEARGFKFVGSKIIYAFMQAIGMVNDHLVSCYTRKSQSDTKNISTFKQSSGSVICAVSGGVDSSVVATLLHRAIGERLISVFVDTGLLRKGEREAVQEMFRNDLKVPLIVVDAKELFLERLQGVIDPEAKRKIIGETFIEVFDKEAKKYNINGEIKFLAQGTLYSDVIESISVKGPSKTIKSHHNVGGLPEWMKFELIEPLRELFKDEVRALGRELGMPQPMLMRHPFPGPGLAIRIMGEVNEADLDLLREADSIFIEELRKNGLYDKVWQAFCVLLNVRSVGVMGDNRTYDNTICLRAVEAMDGMTASFSHLPHEFLESVSNRIINEVKGINRVVYDITSKPPGTIEWE